MSRERWNFYLSGHAENQFENDVKMYGIQTNKKVAMIITEFDNDVKMYGIQTNSGDMYQFRRLRMM